MWCYFWCFYLAGGCTLFLTFVLYSILDEPLISNKDICINYLFGFTFSFLWPSIFLIGPMLYQENESDRKYLVHRWMWTRKEKKENCNWRKEGF